MKKFFPVLITITAMCGSAAAADFKVTITDEQVSAIQTLLDKKALQVPRNPAMVAQGPARRQGIPEQQKPEIKTVAQYLQALVTSQVASTPRRAKTANASELASKLATLDDSFDTEK